MSSKRFFIALCALLVCGSAFGQGVLGDVLMGKLVKPKKGVWAWYDLSDAASKQTFLMRLAIVDEERVGLKTGHWLEIEVVPLVGDRSVYKMLLTGPASDPKSLHKVVQREGRGEVEEVTISKEDVKGVEAPPEPERKLLGQEVLEIAEGVRLLAEHFEYVAEGEKVDVWVNEEVRPMGIVKMSSSAGELKLRNYGTDGQDARSVINDPLPEGMSGKVEDMKVQVGEPDPAAKAAPSGEPAAPSAPAAPPGTPKPNPKTPKPAGKAGK